MTNGSSSEQWTRTCGQWVARGWRAFNRWRRKCWLTRILILIVIFLPSIIQIVRGPIVVDLVRIACDAILHGSEPQARYHTAKYHERKQIHVLRTLVVARLDTNGDRRLDDVELQAAVALGVDPGILHTRVVDADLDEVLTAARKLNLGVPVPTAEGVRREAWYTAAGETEAMFEEYHREIDSVLSRWYAFRDYRKWSTWREGMSVFLHVLAHDGFEFSLVFLVWLPWLFLVFVLVLSAKDLLGISSERIGILLALIPVVLMLWGACHEIVTGGYDDVDGDEPGPTSLETYQAVYGLAFLSLGLAAGGWAARFGSRVRLDYRIGFGLTVLAAVILVRLRGPARLTPMRRGSPTSVRIFSMSVRKPLAACGMLRLLLPVSVWVLGCCTFCRRSNRDVGAKLTITTGSACVEEMTTVVQGVNG